MVTGVFLFIEISYMLLLSYPIKYFVSIPSTPFFYIKKALADFVYQLKPLLITQRKSFCNCREATSRSPLRSDRLGGAVRFP